MIIKVTVGDNFNRTTQLVDSETTTPREVLEAAEINYQTGVMSLDGVSLRPGDLDTTFEELGVGERAYLTKVAKTDNAC